MSRELVEIWVTQYALSTGVMKVKAEVLEENPGMAVYNTAGSLTQYFHGKDWHLTREAAIARVKEMKVNKLKSIAKSVKKIEDIDPETAVPQ